MILTKQTAVGLWVYSDAPTPQEKKTELAKEFDLWNLFETILPLGHIRAKERKGAPCLFLWGKYEESYKNFFLEAKKNGKY